MSDFKTRLHEEQVQLKERLSKLQAFIDSANFSKIPVTQQPLLKAQAAAMLTYLLVLDMRMKDLQTA